MVEQENRSKCAESAVMFNEKGGSFGRLFCIFEAGKKRFIG